MTDEPDSTAKIPSFCQNSQQKVALAGKAASEGGKNDSSSSANNEVMASDDNSSDGACFPETKSQIPAKESARQGPCFDPEGITQGDSGIG